MGLNLTMKTTILSLHQLGWGERKIARELHLNRKTVTRTLAEKTKLSKDSQPKASKSKCQPYKEVIEAKLRQGLTAQRIWQDLKEEVRFAWSYDSVKTFVRDLTKEEPSAFARMETSPGHEAQVDFGEGAPTLVDPKGQYKKPFLFVMTLSFSRHAYQEVVWRQDVETFIRCHENAFRFFGGVVRVIRLDNLKAGVLKASLFEPELNRVYEAYAHHAGFIPVPCLPRTPQHKGKVEAGVKYTQDNALKGMQFCSLDVQNAHLRHWNATVALPRKHGTTKRVVAEAFKEETFHLRELPKEVFVFFRIAKCRVHNDAFIEVDSAYYMAPEKLIGEDVDVHWNASKVEIFYKDQLLVRHPKASSGTFQKAPGLVSPTKTMTEEEYLDGLFSLSKEIGEECLSWAKKVWNDRKQLGLRTISGIKMLKATYSKAAINKACETALSIGSIQLYAVETLCQAYKESPISLTTNHELIRDPSYYQQIIDQGISHE